MFNLPTLDDSEIARLLQEEYDREVAVPYQELTTDTNSRASSSAQQNSYLPFTSDLSPVDPSLEFTDPTPNINELFLQFNAQFFWGKLAGIEVKWSPRMTLCAGLCVYEGNGGLCSVRLSQPLLKLRPRKDLVETLLHEMIHAYLFVTHNDRDHSDHGPNFLTHMHRINKATGANISVYHTFHDEVELYQQHWWRCSGPCQRKPPYYGYVKRSMNRPPSYRDFWWAEHQATCGGTYTKVKEPEGYGEKKTGKEKEDKHTESSRDIRSFWGQGNVLGSSSSPVRKTAGKPHAGGPTGSSSVKVTVETGGSNKASGDGKQLYTVNGVLSWKTSSADTSYVPSSVTSYSNRTSAMNATTSGRSSSTYTSSSTESPSDCSNVLTTTKPAASNSTAKALTSHTFEDLALAGLSGQRGTRSENRSAKIATANGSVTNRNTRRDKNTKVTFPKNFVSVCNNRSSFSRSVSVKKKKIYVMDELDSNDDLWEELDSGSNKVSDGFVIDSNIIAIGDGSSVASEGQPVDLMTRTSVGFSETTSHMNNIRYQNRKNVSCSDSSKSVSVVSNRPISTVSCSDSSKSVSVVSSRPISTVSCSDSSKSVSVVNSRPISTVSCSDSSKSVSVISSRPISTVRCSDNSRYVSESRVGKFLGQGHVLGTGKAGTTFLSQCRKTWQQQQLGATANPDLPLVNDDAHKGTLAQSIKRKLAEAFGEHDSCESSKRKHTRPVRGEIFSGHTLPENVLGGTTWAAERRGSNDGENDSGGHVSCPVCSSMMLMEEINAHLDLCLIPD